MIDIYNGKVHFDSLIMLVSNTRLKKICVMGILLPSFSKYLCVNQVLDNFSSLQIIEVFILCTKALLL